jgi:predicted small secreted protein
MKKFILPLLVVLAIVVLAACSSIPGGANLSSAVSAVAGAKGSTTVAGSVSGAVDFQSGEVLCSEDNAIEVGTRFAVARVLTPASSATKNQAEIIWVDNGKKEWVNFVVNSRKASKADMVVGANVFVCHSWDKMDSEQYRKDTWYFGAITSTDNLYKGRVEVGSDSYVVDYIRIPTDPIK